MSDQELRRLHGECCAYCHGSGSDRTCPKTESEPWGAEDATTSFAAEEEHERARLRAEGAAAERARIVAALRKLLAEGRVAPNSACFCDSIASEIEAERL